MNALHRHHRQSINLHRVAFTLVEVLVTLVVLSILAGMTLTGIRSAQQSARLAQTQGLVQRINEVLLTKYDEYRYRVLPVQFPSVTPANDAQTVPQLLPDEAGRARLMMLRDLMRMELPDCKADLFTAAGNPMAATVVRVKGVIYEDGDPLQAVAFPTVTIPWTASPLMTGYQNRVVALCGSGANWTIEHQSAECLYLVLSSITYNGIAALDVIAPYQIDDVDGDNMSEIVDAWGNPISLIRWPAGSSKGVIRPNVADEFDLISSDWGAEMGNAEVGYSLTPEIISPGLDGVLGVRLASQIPTPYHLMAWPAAATNNGIGTHTYIDPFMRAESGGIGTPPTPDYSLRPGAYLGAPGRADATDNVSSFDL